MGSDLAFPLWPESILFGHARVQELGIPSRSYLGSGVMRTCFFRAEKRNHLPVEGGQIRRLPTADPVAVSDYFTVYPMAAGIANVILDGVIAGYCPPLRQSRRAKKPRSVTDH